MKLMKSLFARMTPTVESLALIALVSVAVGAGYEGARALQVWALAMPLLLWLWWPIQRRAWIATRSVAVAIWSALFIADGAARGYLWLAYGAPPDSSVVVAAMANTNSSEALEYLSMYGFRVAVWCISAIVAVLTTAWLARQPGSAVRSLGRDGRWRAIVVGAACVSILASAAGYISKPWRRWHPAAFWPHWSDTVVQLRDDWANQDQNRNQAINAALKVGPVRRFKQPTTVVLVIGDSVNRDNMQLYGYPRSTTPLLDARSKSLGSDLTVLRDAWSTEPGTVAAMKELFELDGAKPADTMHALALARAAGFEIWWISNHNDLAIEQLHGGFAHELRMVNRVPGRATASLDSVVLEPLKEALQDSSGDKLIVVHLLGAHPRYRLRFPADMQAINGEGDSVDQEMAREGRSWWLRRIRVEYDTAIRFHDQILSKTLDATIASISEEERGAWMYVSDHGQEVGHEIDHAGHSPGTQAGYKIPALIWQSSVLLDERNDVAARSFRSDWTAWTLAGLLGVTWPGKTTSRDVLSSDYEWLPPRESLDPAVHDGIVVSRLGDHLF